ncbi:hypothetical protein QR680_001446 [Steinernema hermaphroditum]|uniref:Brix domain-containing protein n=1 Tax=Steinernema hermaphroditum TaxID=289476 RepID=A0AA39GZ29_9BILA|nr:hypothetical protein QR680_001446 [Steinernema hermaphroditum]
MGDSDVEMNGADTTEESNPSKKYKKLKLLPGKANRGRNIKLQKKADKRERQDARKKLRKKLGDDAPPKEQPKTLESMREYEVTTVDENDEEVEHDEQHDEMASYFNRETKPKVLLTMSPYARANTFKFCFEMKKCIPDAEVFTRKGVPLKKIIKQATEKGYTDVIVVHEENKMPNGIVISHLPEGPTAYFKINSLQFSKDIKGVGESTSHLPEVIMNNFNTRLGHSVSRMLACLFPHDPNFVGRRVVTFHNQRDYIFFRHHRYEFKKNGDKAALHELGPRFTLRLKWLQKGTFDSRCGEFEWVFKRHEMETSRRRFML